MADPRVHVSIRVGQKGYDWVEEVAAALGVDRSTVHRAALAIAKRHEPELKLLIKEMQA